MNPESARDPRVGVPRGDIVVSPTSEALMKEAAERFVTVARIAIDTTDRFVVALAGGSTPKALYELLATPRYASLVDWSRVHVCWGDERCVPPNDGASNFHMTRAALFARVPLPASNVHRIHGEDDPRAAADAYESELRALFATPAGPPRLQPRARFDLVLLGMGDNGHTASLFPRLSAVRERERWVVAEYVAQMSMWRVTLTPVVLNAAAEILFLVAGHKKAAMLHRVIEGPLQPEALPAQAIAPQDGRLTWLVDAAAAADLDRSRSLQ